MSLVIRAVHACGLIDVEAARSDVQLFLLVRTTSEVVSELTRIEHYLPELYPVICEIWT